VHGLQSHPALVSNTRGVIADERLFPTRNIP